MTIPLMKVVECSLLEEDEVPIDAREFTLKNGLKIMQIFADGQKLCFPLPAGKYVFSPFFSPPLFLFFIFIFKHLIIFISAEKALARLAQWVQMAQDKLAQEIMSQTTIEVNAMREKRRKKINNKLTFFKFFYI
jgi:hypothetical protein